MEEYITSLIVSLALVLTYKIYETKNAKRYAKKRLESFKTLKDAQVGKVSTNIREMVDKAIKYLESLDDKMFVTYKQATWADNEYNSKMIYIKDIAEDLLKNIHKLYENSDKGQNSTKSPKKNG